MNKQKYEIRTKHPAGWNDGKHTVEVIDKDDGSLSVKCLGVFGYSRPYRTERHIDAIRLLLGEHACKLVGPIKPIE